MYGFQIPVPEETKPQTRKITVQCPCGKIHTITIQSGENKDIYCDNADCDSMMHLWWFEGKVRCSIDFTPEQNIQGNVQ
jgi:hypothetical protein